MCNFADDTAIFATDSCLGKVLERLETDVFVLSKWLPGNFMKLNDGKCYLLTLGQSKVEEASVEGSSEEKLLGVILDKNLNFESHISSFSKRATIILKNFGR